MAGSGRKRLSSLRHSSLVDLWLLLVLLLAGASPCVRSNNVRLMGSSRPNEGRLEVLSLHHRWVTVCDDQFDYIEAGVVCNHLGFGYKGNVMGNGYGSGTGQLILKMQCVGNETSVADCSFSVPSQGCNHSQDVSVSCGRSPVQYGPLPNTDNFFIVADKYLRNIYQVGATSGTTAQLLPFGAAFSPTAVAYDSTTKLIYWTDVAVGTINRYSLLTSTNTVIYRDPLNIAVHTYLAIDVRRQKLYYADMANNGTEIGELSTNGDGRRILVNISDYQPGAIVLDDKNRNLYWTSFNQPAIYRISLDTSSRNHQETLINTNLGAPFALAIDFAADVMYWGDDLFGKIETAKTDGSNRRTLVTFDNPSATVHLFYSFVLAGGNIYFTELHSPDILRSNIETGRTTRMFAHIPFQRPAGMVFIPNRKRGDTEGILTPATASADKRLTTQSTYNVIPTFKPVFNIDLDAYMSLICSMMKRLNMLKELQRTFGSCMNTATSASTTKKSTTTTTTTTSTTPRPTTTTSRPVTTTTTTTALSGERPSSANLLSVARTVLKSDSKNPGQTAMSEKTQVSITAAVVCGAIIIVTVIVVAVLVSKRPCRRRDQSLSVNNNMLELHQQPDVQQTTTFSNPLYDRACLHGEACAHPADVHECSDDKREIYVYRPTSAALQHDRGVQHPHAAVHSHVQQ